LLGAGSAKERLQNTSSKRVRGKIRETKELEARRSGSRHHAVALPDRHGLDHDYAIQFWAQGQMSQWGVEISLATILVAGRAWS